MVVVKNLNKEDVGNYFIKMKEELENSLEDLQGEVEELESDLEKLDEIIKAIEDLNCID